LTKKIFKEDLKDIFSKKEKGKKSMDESKTSEDNCESSTSTSANQNNPSPMLVSEKKDLC